MSSSDGVLTAPGADTRFEQFRAQALTVARGIGQIRIPDFLLFFMLVAIPQIPGVSFKPTAFILGAGVLLAAFRRPTYHLGTYSWWMGVAALALVYVAIVSFEIPPEVGAASWQGRLLRLSTVFAFLFATASGRIDLRSGLLGYATAMALNIPLFYAGLLPDTYGGVLTGWFGDKNVAGMAYCLFGLMLLWFARNRTWHILIYVGMAIPLWLTGSRTSLAGYAAAGLWILIARYLPLIARWIFGGLLYSGVVILATRFAQVGVFADRAGSDRLRASIDAASEVKVHGAGFFGRGLGSAFVDMGADGTWFFHNSYWTALVEGGWPWTIFIVGITVVVMIRPFTPVATREQFIAQGVGIAALVCASQLGEVFGTLEWGIAMAFALRMLVTAKQEPQGSAADAE